MTAYWVLLLAPLLGALGPVKFDPSARRLGWLLFCLLAIVLVGLRHEVGGDWYPYLTLNGLAIGPWRDYSITSDPAYYTLNWLSANIGWGVYGVNVICAAIFVAGLAFFCSRQPLPWLALVVAVPYLLVVVSMGYTRQAAALGLVFLALCALDQRRVWIFALLIAVGVTFHKTAVLLLPLAFLVGERRSLLNLAGLLIACVLGVAALALEHYEALWHNYVAETQLESEGAAFRVWMNAVPALLLLLTWTKWRRKFDTPNHWGWLAAISIAAMLVVGIASTAVDRMALYLAPIQLYIWTRVPLLFKDRALRSFSVAAICAAYVSVLYVWLNFASQRLAWIPYQSILWSM